MQVKSEVGDLGGNEEKKGDGEGKETVVEVGKKEEVETGEIVPEAQESAEVALFHGVPVTRMYEEYSSKEFRDLESYILTLESSPKWHTIGHLEGVDGFRLSRSKFSSEVPVLRFNIDFNAPLPTEFVLNMFGDPSFRMSWDPRIAQMNKIYDAPGNYFLHYQLVSFNAPLQDREFLTKYYMKKLGGNETRIVLKSTKHEVCLFRSSPSPTPQSEPRPSSGCTVYLSTLTPPSSA